MIPRLADIVVAFVAAFMIVGTSLYADLAKPPAADVAAAVDRMVTP
jgi:hypothetical protein